MTTLHVIYRVDGEGTPEELWTTYSFPEGIYVSGDALQRARLAFHQATQLHFTHDDFTRLDVTEHIERPVVDDIYVRVAVDRHSLDRDIAATALKASLTVSARAADIRSDFAADMWPTLADERVVVACVARDSIRWVLEQTSALDAVGVCTAGPSVREPSSRGSRCCARVRQSNRLRPDRPRSSGCPPEDWASGRPSVSC